MTTTMGRLGYDEMAQLRRENRQLQGENQQLQDQLRAVREELRIQAHAACHDALTGLPNRRLLEAASPAEAAIMADLDGFKPFNDLFGHDVGDAALKIMAGRLAQRLGADWLPVRIGGDEFAAIRGGSADEAALAGEASELAEVLARPVYLVGRWLRVGCSIGLAVSAVPMPVQLLLRAADAALATAKARSSRSPIQPDGAGNTGTLLVVVNGDRATPVRVVARAAAPGQMPTWAVGDRPSRCAVAADPDLPNRPDRKEVRCT